MKVILDGFIEWKRMGPVAELEGVLITPGTYQGIDGKKVTYSRELLTKKAETILGTQIKYTHQDNAEAVVGFNTGVRTDGGYIFNRGYIFDRNAIEELEKNPKKLGQSMEADVQLDDLGRAMDLTFTASAIGIENPACPEAVIQNIKEVRLGRMSATNDVLATYNDGVQLAGPTRTEFLAWVEKELDKAGVEEVAKVMSVIKSAIKSPYPYPYPSPRTQAQKDVETELSAYTDFVGKCVRGGKSLEECAKEWKEKQEGRETEVQDEALKNQLKLMTQERDSALAKARAFSDSKVEELVGAIKQVEKDFDSKIFLKGIEDPEVQMRLLEKYKVALGAGGRPGLPLTGNPGTADARAKQILKETFGVEDPKELVRKLTEVQ